MIRPGSHRWLSGPIVIESSSPAIRGRDGLGRSPVRIAVTRHIVSA
jgi:hypothetical protein